MTHNLEIDLSQEKNDSTISYLIEIVQAYFITWNRPAGFFWQIALHWLQMEMAFQGEFLVGPIWEIALIAVIADLNGIQGEFWLVQSE